MGVSNYNVYGYPEPTAKIATDNASKQEHRLKISEAQEQKNLIEWAHWNERKYPGLGKLFAIGNGGSRHKLEAINLKKQGIRAGVSDLYLSVAHRGYHGMYIEMKSKGGRLSEKQSEWINGVREEGYAAFVCYSSSEAIEKIEWYLSGAETKVVRE